MKLERVSKGFWRKTLMIYWKRERSKGEDGTNKNLTPKLELCEGIQVHERR
jgi:hypothetical protein